MKGIFDFDNPVFRVIVKFGYIWYLNLLWLVTSLPVITIGASTTALIYSLMKLHDDRGYVTRNFFHSFKENFKQATGIWAIYLVFLVLMIADFILWHQIDETSLTIGLMIALAILWLSSIVWVFAIQSKFTHPVKDTIKYAFGIAYRHLKETIAMMITVFSIVYFNVTGKAVVNFFTLAFAPGLVTYLFTYFYLHVFDQYIKKAAAEEKGLSDQERREKIDKAAEALLASFEAEKKAQEGVAADACPAGSDKAATGAADASAPAAEAPADSVPRTEIHAKIQE